MEVLGHRERVVTTTIYSVAIVFGILLNVFIVCIYAKLRKRSNNQFCRFLLHFSLLNIGQCIGIISYLVIDVAKLNKHSKTVDSLLCSVTDGHSSMLVFSLASCLLLTFMSVCRCDAITNVFPRYLNEMFLNRLFVGVWTLGCFAFVPYIFSYKLNHRLGVCERSWVISDAFGTVYMVLLYIMGLVIPLVTMTTTCFISYVKLYRCKATKQGVRSRRRQIITLLSVLVTVYVITWFPYSVYWLLTVTKYRYPSMQRERMRVLRYVLIPSVFGCIVAPVCYVFQWTDFRNATKRFLCCITTATFDHGSPSNRKGSARSIARI